MLGFNAFSFKKKKFNSDSWALSVRVGRAKITSSENIVGIELMKNRKNKIRSCLSWVSMQFG